MHVLQSFYCEKCQQWLLKDNISLEAAISRFSKCKKEKKTARRFGKLLRNLHVKSVSN